MTNDEEITTLGEIWRREAEENESKFGKEIISKRHTESPYLEGAEIIREREGYVYQIHNKVFENYSQGLHFVWDNIRHPEKDIVTQVRFNETGKEELCSDVTVLTDENADLMIYG